RPRLLRLTKEGRGAWQRFTDDLAHEMNADDFPEHLHGPWAKMRGYGGRLALIVHLIRWACGDVKDEDVDGLSMDSASALIGYFKAHTKRTSAAIGGDRRTADAKRILAWIQREQRTEFKRWEAYEDLRSARQFPSPDSLDKPLELLRQHNFIRGRGVED